MGGRHSRIQDTDDRASRRRDEATRSSRGSDLLQSADRQRAYRRDPSARPRRSNDDARTRTDRRFEEPQESSRARWLKGAVLVLLIAAACAILLVFLRTCAPAIPESGAGGDETEETLSPYEQTAFQRAGDRWAYVVDGEVRSKIGIDVSESQLWIDWQAVAADGIDFAMIRAGYRGATEGDLYTDEYFFYNLEAAQEAGVDCGVYFFSQAVTVDEAIEEADYVLDLLGSTKLEYPIAFDSEEFAVEGVTSRIAELTRDEMTSIAEAFCNRVRQAGYDTMVYGNAYDLSRYNKGNWEGAGVWWAEYDELAPSVTSRIRMWQYANSGQVAGIETNVDMNMDLKDALASTQEEQATKE